ncbi:multidrug effflux MFS transporter [Nonomuraea sp. NPDC050310]|uniref:multidrug effflux MFS transporter n=1 Tax=unclassified Nonomuraea TaxID=2593643 RepID=UPI0033C6CBD0
MSVAVEAASAKRTAKERRGLLLLILGALSAIGPLSIDMYLPALPTITHELATVPAQVQLTLTACLIGVSMGQILAGPLSDSRGRRLPLLIGVGGYAVASLLCAFAPNVGALIVLRLLQGVLGGAALVIVRAVVRDLYDGAAIARIFANLMLVSGLAPILAPIAGAQLLEFTSWRGVFVALSIAGLVLLAVTIPGVRETLPREERVRGGLAPTARTFWRLLRERTFMAPALASGLGFAAMFGYISGSPFVLQEVYGLSTGQYSLVFGANALALTISAQVGGRLAGRVNPGKLVLGGLFASLAGGLLVLAAGLTGLGLYGVLAGLFVLMAGAGLVMPGAGALALGSQPSQIAGSASALLGVLQFALGALSAPLVGLLGGGAVAMAVVILILMGAAFTAFTVLRRVR